MLPSKLSFLEMVDSIDTHLKRNEKGSKMMFEMFFQNCHPFVFVPSGEVSNKELEIMDQSEPLDLPFPCISIELSNNTYLTVSRPTDEARFNIISLIAAEIAPKQYDFLVYVEKDINASSRMRSLFHVPLNTTTPNKVWDSLNALLKVYLARLSKEKIGVESTDATTRKLGAGKSKKILRPKPITYVSPKKYVSSVKASAEERTIDWSHRWEVRGHWRTVRGVGKDRTGNYTVSGYTWVSNHVKGPEDALLVKKTYVVGE